MILHRDCDDQRRFQFRHSTKRMVNLVVAGWWMLSLAASCTVAAAVEPTIATKASTTTVRVAEPFTVSWTVVAPTGSKVTFPNRGKQLGDFDILNTSDQFDIPQAGSTTERTWTRRMTLETVQTGDLQIPELEIQIQGTNGKSTKESEAARTQPLTIRVASVLEDRADPTQFRDIESVVDVNVPVEHPRNSLGWTLAAAAGGLALLAATGVVVLRKRGRVTPKTWALNELADLELATSTGTVSVEASTIQISDILRGFLLLQLNIDEAGLTSHEVLQKVESEHHVERDIASRIGTLFSLADDAKFAGLPPSERELNVAIEQSRELIQTIASSQRR